MPADLVSPATVPTGGSPTGLREQIARFREGSKMDSTFIDPSPDPSVEQSKFNPPNPGPGLAPAKKLSSG